VPVANRTSPILSARKFFRYFAFSTSVGREARTSGEIGVLNPVPRWSNHRDCKIISSKWRSDVNDPTWYPFAWTWNIDQENNSTQLDSETYFSSKSWAALKPHFKSGSSCDQKYVKNKSIKQAPWYRSNKQLMDYECVQRHPYRDWHCWHAHNRAV